MFASFLLLFDPKTTPGPLQHMKNHSLRTLSAHISGSRRRHSEA